MAEGADRDDRIENKAAQLSRRTIRARNDGRRRTEEGLKVQELFFYAEYGMVDSTDPGWLQTMFDTLTGLFDWVGLKKNVWKTMGVVYHPCQAAGVRAD